MLSFSLNFSYFGIILMTTSLLGQSSSVNNATCLDDYAFCVRYCSLSLADYVALIAASCGDLLGVPLPLPVFSPPPLPPLPPLPRAGSHLICICTSTVLRRYTCHEQHSRCCCCSASGSGASRPSHTRCSSTRSRSPPRPRRGTLYDSIRNCCCSCCTYDALLCIKSIGRVLVTILLMLARVTVAGTIVVLFLYASEIRQLTSTSTIYS